MEEIHQISYDDQRYSTMRGIEANYWGPPESHFNIIQALLLEKNNTTTSPHFIIEILKGLDKIKNLDKKSFDKGDLNCYRPIIFCIIKKRF